jgi:hypothetical protein
MRTAVATCLAGYAGSVVGAVSSTLALEECGVFACDGGSWLSRSKYSD